MAIVPLMAGWNKPSPNVKTAIAANRNEADGKNGNRIGQHEAGGIEEDGNEQSGDAELR